jgi:S1-C subfamily serine protease
VDRGVLVTRIADGSPAEAAGLAEGDIIIQIGNAETNKIEDLVKEIQKEKSTKSSESQLYAMEGNTFLIQNSGRLHNPVFKEWNN